MDVDAAVEGGGGSGDGREMQRLGGGNGSGLERSASGRKVAAVD